MGSGTVSARSAGAHRELGYVIAFEAAGSEPIERVGGKCKGLSALVEAKAPVSPGFVITTDAFDEMMLVDGLGEEIASILTRIDAGDVRGTADAARAIAAAIDSRPLPEGLAKAVREAYARLGAATHGDAAVAVRSSGTGEDLPDASFAGQGDTFLSVVGGDAVLDKVKKCWASLYSARAMAYRTQCGMGHGEVRMAVAVQVMVEARSAGVAMTLDPGNGDRSKIVVESTWGLGETLVSGEVTPDHFVVDKVMLMPVSSKIATKECELVADPATRSAVRREVEAGRRDAPSISQDELVAIARAAKQIERHFGCPQDIEWAIDEKRIESGGVVILQSRPETVWSRKQAAKASSVPGTSGAAGILDTLIAPLQKKQG